MFSVLLLLSSIWSGPAGPVPHEPGSSSASRHDFHVSIGRMAVEGNQAILQIRLFKDDLEKGMRAYFSDEALTLQVDQRTDSLFTVYINKKLVVRHAGAPIKGVVASSGEDTLYGYPVWWYTLSYKASSDLNELDINHQVLMEMFDDQQNVLRVTHFPSEKERMYYLVAGSSEVKIAFEG